jgi:hypothetical protein
LNSCQDHVHPARHLECPLALDQLATSLSIQDNEPVLTHYTGPSLPVCPHIQFKLHKAKRSLHLQPEFAITSLKWPPDCPRFDKNRPKTSDIITLRLVQQGFRDGKTSQKAIIKFKFNGRRSRQGAAFTS